MKKSLLISAALLIGACVVNAQSQRIITRSTLAKKAYPILKNLPTDLQFPNAIPAQSSGMTTKKNPSVLASKLLGYTCYELQSNSSMGRQLINHPDGTLSFVWTIDDACDAANTNRGSGYNYWNGTALLGVTSVRLEAAGAANRTGFSYPGILGNGKEVVFAHKGPPYDFLMSTNAAKGSNTWTSAPAGATIILPTAGVNQGLWGRFSVAGPDTNSIHLIAGYFEGSALGITTPTTYSRSLDGGQSWNDQSVMLPGYDSTRTYFGSGEAYAIDAQESTVAIVYGGLDADVILWKSTDNGGTFTRTSVDSYAFEPTFDSTAVWGDTAMSNDGAVTVVLGSNGTAHVAYSTARLFLGLNTAGDTASLFSPADAELVYWNDVAKNKIHIPITINDVDCPRNGGDNTGDWEVGQYSTNINGNAAPTPPSARYGNRAFLTIPSIAVDGNNVFILFSLVSDGDSTVDGQSYRDIWIVASADGGATFGKVQNITCSFNEEEFFGSLAKRVDANLHYMYGFDTEPGTAVQNGDPIATAEVRYGTIDKALVLAGTANCQPTAPVCLSGVDEYSTAVFNISSNYPNPASALTYFDINMKQNGSVSFEIFNNVGQQVYTTTKKLSNGKHSHSVDVSTFTSGLYFYTIKSGDSIVSGKMTVITK